MSTDIYRISDNDIGKRLLEYRKKTGKSGIDFAEIIGISQGSLSDIERGKTKPSAKAIIGLIQKTNIDIRWLLTGEEQKRPGDIDINPLLIDVNEWLNEEKKDKETEFCNLFKSQMVRAFFDYERWIQKREEREGGGNKFPASKVA